MKNKRRIYVVIIFVAAFVYLVVAITGLLRDIREKKELDLELKAKILQQEEEYEALLQEKQLIQESDPEYMEEKARELGMLKEGEILFEERKD